MTPQEKNLQTTLTALGLSKRESEVYIALLALGKGTVTQISRKAGINRTTGYDILDALHHNGLVQLTGKKPKEEYVAESPTKLLDMVHQQLAEAERRVVIATKCIPELETIRTLNDRPSVRFYEGKEGLKQVYEDTLTSSEPIVAYAAYEDMHATLGDYFPQYYKRRAEKGIGIRGIVPDSEASRERAQKNKRELRDIAIVPKAMFDISPDIEIYDNKVMIASWREKLGIIIESTEIAHAMKQIFELAFAEAKRIEGTTHSRSQSL